MFKETLWINILRSFCAGIVWIIISLFMPADGNPFYYKLFAPIVMPFLLGTFYLVSLVLKIFKLGGIGNIMCMLVAVPGDPLVYFLFKLKPEWVPVKEYRFLWFAAIITVYKEERDIPISKKETNTENKPCTYVGRIVVDKETEILTIPYTTSQTIFTITEDWRVSTPEDSKFGWIDIDGMIHKGITFDVNPHATLSGEITGLVVRDKHLYRGYEKVADLVSN